MTALQNKIELNRIEFIAEAEAIIFNALTSKSIIIIIIIIKS